MKYYQLPFLTGVKNHRLKTSLAVQRSRLRTSTAGSAGSITGQGTRIPNAARYGQKTKQNKTNKQTKPPADSRESVNAKPL